MNLSEFTITKLVPLINGEIIKDNKITPYKTGPELVKLFNDYGIRDIYNNGLPNNVSRKDYTKTKLLQINCTKNMEKFINDLVHSQQYLHTDYILDDIVNYINDFIKYDGYEFEKTSNEYIVIGDGLIKDEKVEIKPTFEKIQQEIIGEIRKAKYIIWVAVAWFTDDAIFKELIKKKQEGLNIQIIVSNDKINEKLNFESHFETYRINPFGIFCDNIFHNKFCIIDLNTVIQGSYNWSKKAQYNGEGIDTVKSIVHAEEYAERFKELKIGLY